MGMEEFSMHGSGYVIKSAIIDNQLKCFELILSGINAQVLEQDPVNVKALYRRCHAYLKTSDLEKAEADINRALIIDPNNRDMRLEYKELKLKQKEYSRNEADIFSTMLSRMG